MPARPTITSKGQVTIPKEIRRRLGLEQGDRVEFTVEGDRTYMRAVPASDDPFTPYAGALASLEDARDVDAWLRELRDP